MRIEAPHPFSAYTAYRVFHKQQKRWQVCLVPLDGGKRTTILYAKFVLSIALGRVLARDEEVDHIDGNKLNDDLCNLAVVSRRENRRRYDRAHPGAVLKLKCAYCGVEFVRRRNQTTAVRHWQLDDYCSRSCVGKSVKARYG